MTPYEIRKADPTDPKGHLSECAYRMFPQSFGPEDCTCDDTYPQD